jgi:hypothetical protein
MRQHHGDVNCTGDVSGFLQKKKIEKELVAAWNALQ